MILKATSIQHLAEKALEYFGDENTVFEKLGENQDSDEEQAEQNVGNGCGDHYIIKVTVEDTSEVVESLENGIRESGNKESSDVVKNYGSNTRYVSIIITIILFISRDTYNR